MECYTPIDDYCGAEEAPYLRSPELAPPSTDNDQFYIRFVLEFLYPKAGIEVDDDDFDEFDENNFECYERTGNFWAPCDRLQPNKLSHEFISGMLSGMGVPANRQPFLLQKISDRANVIAGAAHNKSEKILPMVVFASVVAVPMDYAEEEAELKNPKLSDQDN